jgi:hypothetical protein
LNVHYFVAFLRSQKEVQVRQQTIFKKKDGCQIASTKLFFAQLFASTNSFLLSCLRQQPRHQLLGLIWRNNSQIVPKNGLLHVQVNYKYFVEFTSAFYKSYTGSCTSAFECSYKCSICLTVILTAI